MAEIVEGNEIANVWEKLVKNIMNNGEIIKDERGSNTKEILNIISHIKEPFGEDKGDFFNLGANLDNLVDSIENIRIPEGYFWSGDKLKIYSEQFISSDKQGFVYTYGNRLRGHFGSSNNNDKDNNNDIGSNEVIDQIDNAIQRLKSCMESRRAISITWDPVLDSTNDEVPCMILVDFKIRLNKLYTTGLWRSHDIYGAWFPNAVGLSDLAKYVAKNVDVDIGTITIHSISAHIYETDFKEAEIVAKR